MTTPGGRPAGIAIVVVVILLAFGRAAWADEAAADRAFRAAQQRALANDPAATEAAIGAFEALGAAQPPTRWTDDAWAEAARLAERSGDFARARRALAQVIALGTDEQLVRRARATLARLTAITGEGTWDEVAREHERLVAGAFDGDDPRTELEALEALVARHPSYPRANAIRRALARGWEQEGHTARALRWLREAAAAAAAEPGQHVRLELVRALIRTGELDAAERELSALASSPAVDRAVLVQVRAALWTAERRAWIRIASWGVLGVLAIAAALALRRAAGTWRAAARRIVRPPIEAVFLIPIAAVLAVFASTGNPLVAGAVRWIVSAGVAIAWVSGELLEAHRARGPVGARRVLVHVVAALIAGGTATYLAVDRHGVIDFVIETWRGGHALR